MHTNHNIPYFSIIVGMLVLTSCASAVDDPDVCRTMNLVYCDGICADPMTSPKYCGANDSCSDYTSCNSDEYCTEGHCKKVATETHDESGTCADFKKYCKNNSIIGCINGNITVEEFCTGSTPVCDPHTVTCTALPEAVCTDGDFKCESNVPSVCIGNTWHTKSLCAKGTYCNSLSGECTSGPVELDPEESCETDSVRCENNVPVVCSESRWILREKCNDDSYCNSMTAHCDKIETLDCNKTPDDPQCTVVQPPTPVCSNNEQRCFYGKIQQCQDNEWTDLASCESGKCANENDCEQLVCHTGDTQCSDAILQMCADNAWLDVLECPSGLCEDGKCINTTGENDVCQTGEIQCSESGIALQICTENTWQDIYSCSSGKCQAGSCTDIINNSHAVLCNGQLIDPNTSHDYCGANANCENYITCNDEQRCYMGKCYPICFEFSSVDFTESVKTVYDYNQDGCLQAEEVFTITDAYKLKYYPDDVLTELPALKVFPPGNRFQNASVTIQAMHIQGIINHQIYLDGGLLGTCSGSYCYDKDYNHATHFTFSNMITTTRSCSFNFYARKDYVKYIDFPKLKEIDSKLSLTASDSQQLTLKLTTPEDINIISLNISGSKYTTLYLNKNKSPDGSGSPKATSTNEWAGVTWKKIIYVD